MTFSFTQVEKEGSEIAGCFSYRVYNFPFF